MIATSDHGAAPYAGNIRKATPNLIRELEKLGHYSSGIYRGYKFTVFEGGLRVPFVVRWPGAVTRGSRCERLVGLNDLAATLADVAGVKTGAEEAPDSFSIVPLLKDPGAAGADRALVMQSPLAFAVRYKQWKLALTPSSGSRGLWGTLPVPERAWGEALASFGSVPTESDLRQAPFVQLFDLEADVRETNNLAADRADAIRLLNSALDDVIQQGRSTPGPALSNDAASVDLHRNARSLDQAASDFELIPHGTCRPRQAVPADTERLSEKRNNLRSPRQANS